MLEPSNRDRSLRKRVRSLFPKSSKSRTCALQKGSEFKKGTEVFENPVPFLNGSTLKFSILAGTKIKAKLVPIYSKTPDNLDFSTQLRNLHKLRHGQQLSGRHHRYL